MLSEGTNTRIERAQATKPRQRIKGHRLSLIQHKQIEMESAIVCAEFGELGRWTLMEVKH